ncbi:MAG: PAS domain-containing sensor histidine kinase [bacterium]
MKPAAVPPADEQYLGAPGGYELRDASDIHVFEDFAELGRLACGATAAAIVLVDNDREWFAARTGLDADIPVHALHFVALAGTDERELLIIVDALADDRFAHHPLVARPPHARFCLNANLVSMDGARLGSLCIIANEPRQPSNEQCAVIQTLRRRIVAEVERQREGERARSAQLLFDQQTSGQAREMDEERRALRESVDVYRMLVEQAGDGVIITDGQSFRLLEVNDSACALMGYSRDEMLELSSPDLVLPEDIPLLMGTIAGVQSGLRVVSTRRFRRKDSSLFWGEIISKALPDGRLQGMVRDVTERLRLEEERAAILERVTDAFIALDADGRYTWVNEKAASTFGRRPEDLLGKNIWAEFADTISRPLQQACEQVMREQKPIQFEDYYEPHDRWYEDRIFPSKTGISIFFSDITERKRAEAALNLSEERFRVLVEQGADVVLMLNADGELTWASPSVRRVLGFEPDEVVGRSVLSFVHPDDVAQSRARFLGVLAKPGESAPAAFRARHKDGSWRTIEGIGVNRFDDPAFGAVVASWHDVTEQREAERILLESADQLRRLSQRLQVVREEEQAHLSRELHDRLGQSLTMLKLGLSRVITRMAAGDPTVLDQVRLLGADVDASIHATRQISAELRPPLLEDLGLAAALEWAGQRFADRTGIVCTMDLHDQELPVEAARALYAISQEAFTNIVRHSAAHNVTVRLARAGDVVLMEVSDDGIGFDQSAEADLSTLGLLGMRERASAVGAVLAVRSQSGTRTTVSIRLPLYDECEMIT